MILQACHSAPLVEFDKLLTMFREPDDVLTPELYASVRELLARKARTELKGVFHWPKANLEWKTPGYWSR